MKYILVLMTSLIATHLSSQNEITGTWKAIDDKDGQPTSHIEIFENDGKIHGKIVKLYDQPTDLICELCPGDKKDTPLIGLEILWGMKADGDEWTGGRILDPEDGKTYKCKLAMNDDGTLKVRGYIGIPTLGRNQKWYRAD